MIEALNISKSYGKLNVLKEVNLSIAEKEIVSIVGDSGAGKTTLLQLLGSLDKPDTGEIYIAEQNLTKLNRKALAKFRNENIGFVFQFHHLLPEFTALENVLMPSWIKGDFDTKRAKGLLDFMGLSERLHHKPGQLSGGEQQRVAVARALVNNPKVIFADEPSGNLDSKTADKLHDLFFQLREEFGHTLVIVTHNPSLADRADRKLVMKDGKLDN